MSARSAEFKQAIIATTTVIAAVMLASCVSTRSSSPRQVDMSSPTVTYQYRNDDELIKANQRAIAFCEPYQSLPRAQSFSYDSEHQKIVVFECVATLEAAAIHQPESDLRYDYRTDQELLDLSRNAQVYCRNIGKPEMDSSIVVNSNGSRTVTFHCRPR
jgi:hypothetical protein